MRRLAYALSLPLLIALPAQAEEPKDEGFLLMEEGAKLVLRGMMAEMEPAFDEMEKALGDMQPMLDELGPRFAELLTLMGDVTNFHPPEVLENGDILIRRKAPLPEALPPRPGPDGEIEL